MRCRAMRSGQADGLAVEKIASLALGMCLIVPSASRVSTILHSTRCATPYNVFRCACVRSPIAHTRMRAHVRMRAHACVLTCRQIAAFGSGGKGGAQEGLVTPS